MNAIIVVCHFRRVAFSVFLQSHQLKIKHVVKNVTVVDNNKTSKVMAQKSSDMNSTLLEV